MKKFEELLRIQSAIQRDHQGMDIEGMTMGERAQEIIRQQQYLLDEITELMTALGGGFGKAAWKRWKTHHETVMKMKPSDLDSLEWKEVVFEAADVLIFVLNILALADVTGEEVLQAVQDKQNININRWENGY